MQLWQRAAGYGLEGFALDCSDPEHVARTLAATIEKVRATSRPVLIEAHTLRLRRLSDVADAVGRRGRGLRRWRRLLRLQQQ
mgnify:CR=1 FL=1